MGPYHQVDLASGQIGGDIFLLTSGAEAVQAGDLHRERGETFAKGCCMLFGQDGGRNEDRHLEAIFNGFEGRTGGDFGLAVTDIATDEAIHRLITGQIVDDVVDGLGLPAGFIVGKGFLQLPVEIARRRKTVTMAHGPVGRRSPAIPGRFSKPLR